MDNILTSTHEQVSNSFSKAPKTTRIILGILAFSVILGAITGYSLAKRGSSSLAGIPLTQAPKTALQDNRTFKDFAEGTLKVRPAPKNPSEYVEGSHLLIRENSSYPVALTSSVIDLSEYEGKKIKVYGETQKALKEGWLMDVGRVEEVKWLNGVIRTC